MISEAGSSFGRDLRLEADPTDPTEEHPGGYNKISGET